MNAHDVSEAAEALARETGLEVSRAAWMAIQLTRLAFANPRASLDELRTAVKAAVEAQRAAGA